MNDFEGLLSSDFGFKPQGKAAPMSSSSSSSNRPASASLNFDRGGSRHSSDPIFDSKPTSASRPIDDFGDIFDAPARKVDSSFDFESIFNSSSKNNAASGQPPVYDKPVYDDDDIFVGVPGLKTSVPSSARYDHVFEPISSPSPPAGTGRSKGSGGFDDLLGGFGNGESLSKSKKDVRDFDNLIPGFGGNSPSERPSAKSTWSSEPTALSSKTMEDPFVAPRPSSPSAASSSRASVDPLEDFSMFGKSRSTKGDARSAPGGMGFDDMDSFESLGKSVPPYTPNDSINGNERKPLRTEDSNGRSQRYKGRGNSNEASWSTVPTHDDRESNPTYFNMPSGPGSFFSSAHPHEKNNNFNEANFPADTSPGYEENFDSSDEVWLSVSEIPLFTEPTRSGPPSRPPPPRPAQRKTSGSSSFGSASVKKENEFSPSQNSSHHFETVDSIPQGRTATIDEFEDFAIGRNNGNNIHNRVNWSSSEEVDFNSDASASTAAMKEAMDRAEAKFRHAKEMRERESSKSARSREHVHLDRDENWLDAEERALREKLERLEMERLKRDREEQEQERRRIEKEREREEMERERARQIERERARQAVERANREARERAASEARLKAEKAAVEKANTEARERANRAAVLRAQTEARERAAANARERAERAAAEARAKEAQEARDRAERAEKAAAEAREKEARERAAETRRRAERVAVERAAAEARERAAAEARERAAASTRAKQHSNEDDLETFFSMGRASSAPRPRASHSDSMFDTPSPSRKGPEATRTSDSTSNMRKASSSVNIVDDLSSIFGGQSASNNGVFQEVEGETEERRRARLERHQRTQERAAKALAEKNQRDLQAQREQAERHRISETLDVEIKRWSAGKEGNLRSLLATLQYVLWPECGWQPVSLTDLITAAAVKKVYRKATLCIHPDKVQQKGANLQQKYVAEKVFDLLKEAWNKFNSEELF